MSEYSVERWHSSLSSPATAETAAVADEPPGLATIHRLVDDPAAPAQAEPDVDATTDAAAWGQGFARVLGLFDDEAVRLQALREKIQQVGAQMSARERRLQQLEAELAQAGVERLRDQETIERLQHELAERDGRLHRAGTKARELSAIIDGGDLP